jgi:hypothetical protein
MVTTAITSAPSGCEAGGKSLSIGIGGDELNVVQPELDHAVDGVGTASAETEYLYAGSYLAPLSRGLVGKRAAYGLYGFRHGWLLWVPKG